MALLATGPGAKALRHFEAAFLTHEDSSNRTVKPRAHNGAALSAHMIYFDESVAPSLRVLRAADVLGLVRDNKFTEHALPGAYYGPSRSTESDNYCDVWNGTRFFAVHKGSLRIDERRVLAASSRTCDPLWLTEAALTTVAVRLATWCLPAGRLTLRRWPVRCVTW